MTQTEKDELRSEPDFFELAMDVYPQGSAIGDTYITYSKGFYNNASEHFKSLWNSGLWRKWAEQEGYFGKPRGMTTNGGTSMYVHISGGCQELSLISAYAQSLNCLYERVNKADELNKASAENAELKKRLDELKNKENGQSQAVGYFTHRNRELIATIENALKLGVGGDASLILRDALLKATKRERLFCIVSPGQQRKMAQIEAENAALKEQLAEAREIVAGVMNPNLLCLLVAGDKTGAWEAIYNKAQAFLAQQAAEKAAEKEAGL